MLSDFIYFLRIWKHAKKKIDVIAKKSLGPHTKITSSGGFKEKREMKWLMNAPFFFFFK